MKAAVDALDRAAGAAPVRHGNDPPVRNRWKVPVGHPDYGHICPECAGPKHRQSKRCAQCYYAARRRGEYPSPPVRRGAEHPNWKPSGHTGHRKTGGPRGRAQGQEHPWRSHNALLFMERRVREMADRGIRPATAGGRVRAHFATLDFEEDA